VRGVDSSGLVVAGTGRVISVVGLDDIVVVDTPDALLVTSRERAQDVKQVVSRLRQDGRADLT
jgi:mannose-1-phosphate guanylyltransferase